MYVSIASRTGGRKYLSIVHGYRDENGKVRKKTIRSLGYLDELEKMEVSTWLPYTDATAHEALKNPVFRLKLILQVYKEASPVQSQAGPSDITFAPEPETEEKVITLEIAPAGEAGYSRFYYGRVNTSPNYFILNMDAVRLLGASLSEDN